MEDQGWAKEIWGLCIDIRNQYTRHDGGGGGEIKTGNIMKNNNRYTNRYAHHCAHLSASSRSKAPALMPPPGTTCHSSSSCLGGEAPLPLNTPLSNAAREAETAVRKATKRTGDGSGSGSGGGGGQWKYRKTSMPLNHFTTYCVQLNCPQKSCCRASKWSITVWCEHGSWNRRKIFVQSGITYVHICTREYTWYSVSPVFALSSSTL